MSPAATATTTIVVDPSVPAGAHVRINGNAGDDKLVGGEGDDVLEAGENYNGPDNAYPAALARKNGDLGPTGAPTSPNVVRDCTGGRCAYYQYLQGTLMAAPHVAGVAALLVSRYGTPDPQHPGGLRLDPARTEALLLATARPHACPPASAGGPACRGTTAHNGHYGAGIVSATDATAATSATSATS